MNLHDLIGYVREVWWGTLEPNVPIELELIDYFKATEQKRGRGHFIKYYAIASNDYTPLEIEKGDELIISISFKTFVKALKSLKNKYRESTMREFGERKNLYIKFERVTHLQIIIHIQEVREPTQIQLINAEKIYKMLNIRY